MLTGAISPISCKVSDDRLIRFFSLALKFGPFDSLLCHDSDHIADDGIDPYVSQGRWRDGLAVCYVRILADLAFRLNMEAIHGVTYRCSVLRAIVSVDFVNIKSVGL